ncbi:hypothetical protein CEXT_545381 [Caerostris extrusa]|uniref:Uncharacterized protein n=1 Tax=Caerostris extrusa TaxID=172846 RepID=A0AAV4S6D8_CAEEX|nr:hypothetical protein CEXT_545381 [Caerostris extrusa]
MRNGININAYIPVDSLSLHFCEAQMETGLTITVRPFIILSQQCSLHSLQNEPDASQGYPMPRFDESGRARDLRPGPSTPWPGHRRILISGPPAGKDCFEYFATRLRNLSMFETSSPTRDEYQFITHSLLCFLAVSVPRIF